MIPAAFSFGAWINSSAVTAVAIEQACMHLWLFTSTEVSEMETPGELDGVGALGTGLHEKLHVCCQT